MAYMRAGEMVGRLAAKGTDPGLEEVARLRAAIGRISRRLRPTVAGSGLTPSQTAVLFHVARRTLVSPSSIAEAEGIHPTMLSRIVARLCDAGLVTRDTAGGDRRVVLLRATDDGRRLFERIHRERTQALAKHLELLSDGERRRLWAALPVLEELAELLPGGLAA